MRTTPVASPSEGMAADTPDTEYVNGMARLLQAVQELSLARSLPEIQEIVRRSARELTGCDGATFVLRTDDECLYLDEDAITPLWKGSRFPIEACISGWAMLNRKAVVVPDIYVDDRIPREAYRPTFVKSLVMVPIRTLDPVGAIGNYWAQQRQPTAREVSLLQALADATSIAMENVRLYAELEERVHERTAALERANEEIRQLSLTDDLTGLHNRRGFHVLANAALLTARTHGHHCVLAFLDVDGLKKVNDGSGHDAGDRLLVDVAHVLRTTTQASDIVARLGGDEFCVLVPESPDSAVALKARLRDVFGRFNGEGARPYQVAASIGALDIPPTDIRPLDALIACADELMYTDKKTKAATEIA